MPPEWDVFISYASEDERYATRLYNALRSVQLSVWMYPHEVRLGSNVVARLDEGIRGSKHSILLLSPIYLNKTYTVAEFNAIIKRAIEKRGGSVIPLRHGVSQDDLSEFSSFIAQLHNMSTAQSLELVVKEILRSVSPPNIPLAASTSPSSVSYEPIRFGKPMDALNDDVRLFNYRPRLHFENFTFQEDKDEHVQMTYSIANIGEGSANKIRCFLPGLWIDAPQSPVSTGKCIERALLLCERIAYQEIMPIYADVIVEFEDHVGNLYRQYGKLRQPLGPDDRFRYEVPELERPYLVPQRIVHEDPNRFLIEGLT